VRCVALVVLAGCVTALHPSKPPVATVAKPFALPSQRGETVALAGALPAVVVFYRGHW